MKEIDQDYIGKEQPPLLTGVFYEYRTAIEKAAVTPNAYQLILASNSPRRRELLALAGYHFQVKIAEVDENRIFSDNREMNRGETDKEQVALACRAVSEAKAKAVWEQEKNADSLILAADTIVYDGQLVLGKPRGAEDALRMLKSLSGHAHQVMTAVAMISGGEIESFVSITNVHFYPWDSGQEAAALASIRSGSAMDKAGAYGIQDSAALLVEKIEGDYNTVVGLPLAEVYRRLAAKRIFP